MSKAGEWVLLAEDEIHIAKLVIFKLEKEGYQVVHAKDGREAIARLPEQIWATIILDVMMPHCDGWEVLRTVRASELTKTTPVLMLTAKAMPQDQANSASLGATEFLRKPFDPAELARSVGRP